MGIFCMASSGRIVSILLSICLRKFLFVIKVLVKQIREVRNDGFCSGSCPGSFVKFKPNCFIVKQLGLNLSG